MPDLNARVVLSAKADGLKKGVKTSVKDLKGLAKSGTDTAKKLGAIDKSSIKSTKSIKKLGSGSKKLTGQLKKTSRATKDTARAFDNASRTTGNFARKENALGTAIGNTTRKIKNQITQTRALARAQKNASKKRVAAGVSGVANAKAIGAGGVGGRRGGIIAGASKSLLGGIMAFGAASAAKRTYDALIGSIREIDVGKGGLKSLGMTDTSFVVNEGLKLQSEYAGIYAADFTKAAYDIKSGIETLTNKGVADVTAAAVITAKATKGDAANMTSLFATAYGMFKDQDPDMSDSDWGNMFASVIATAVKKNKTDGAKMQQAIEAAGDGVLKLGMSMEEYIAILGILQKTKQAGVAGTNLKAYGSNVANAEAKFNADKGKTKIKLLDENGKILEIEKAIANLKERYGDELDGHEMAEIKKAFGSEEAVSFVTAFWKTANEITKQATDLNAVGNDGLKVAKNMAKSHDDGNIDSEMKIRDQRRDIMLVNAAEVSRQDLLSEYKATGEQYMEAANKIKEVGKAFTSSEVLKLMASAKFRDETGIAQLAGGQAVEAASSGLLGWAMDIFKTGYENNKKYREMAENSGAANYPETAPAYKSNPSNLSKSDYARQAFNAAGVDPKGGMANEASNAYSGGDIDKDHIDILVKRISDGVAVEKIQSLLEQMMNQAFERSKDQSYAEEAVKEGDQPQDNRQYDNRTSVTNHITVKVTTNASPQAIGNSVAAAQNKVKYPAAETLADGGY
ncbi:MAG: hypothetical protein COB24_12035 [Hyphomicrobiales bacterium]|nr:MAG: hypothetical protein COB24_12035 [Hyphomicrobiales bacterium]